MAFPWMAAATLGSAALGYFGQRSASEAQIQGQEQTNAFNAEQAQINRDWQERMYKNRHTYEVEDLYRAGLNPVLSAKYGGGSVPTGAQATYQNPQAHRSQEAISTAQNLMQLAVLGAQKRKLDSETDANKGVIQTPFGRMSVAEFERRLQNAGGFNAKFSQTVDYATRNLKRFSRTGVSGIGARLAEKYLQAA